MLLPGQGVFSPVLVVSGWVVLSCVGTTGLLSLCGGDGCLCGAGQQVAQLHGLDEVAVPDHGLVGDVYVLEGLVDGGDVLDTFVQGLLHSEHGDVLLHGLLHVQSDLCGGLVAAGVSDGVQRSEGLLAQVGRQRLVWCARLQGVRDGVGDGTAEDDQVQQGVGAQSVGTVDGDTGGFTAGHQAWDHLVLAVLVDGETLTGPLGGDTTHVVVDCGQHWDGLLGDVDTCEDGGGLGDTWQSFLQHRGWQVAQLQKDVVLVLADTSALPDLHGHGTGHDVSGGQVLGGWRVTLHEPLTLAVQQEATFTTGTLCDQAAGAVDTGGVELHELEVLQGEARTGDHGVTVTGAGVRGGTGEVRSPVTTGG